ncbi:MAG: AraC family transcriptional regulator [Oscillibacter sp.]|uniref:AraC family transcriptional regulator n=1 Tax=uncultured Oscillibacter sp. TaxID=876091 RepID=UPI00216D6FE6|nr:helix-turn-helix domain-containing protein [uncultured Oscillibacter sp.]MCI9644164.1 AraC family transcriptional regulator [Oscillibacter sp.]
MEDYSFSVFPNENFLDLRLYQYGWERCAPLHSFGPYVRNHYLFHYVISGQGRLDATDASGVRRDYRLGPDQGFLICPGQISTYVADKDQPWKYVWLEFDGLRVPEYMESAGLDSSQAIYRPQSAAEGQKMRDIMLYMADHSDASPLHLTGLLFLFVDLLIRSSSTRRALRGVQLKDFYIQEAINYMEHNYQRELSVEELADVCKLNRSYFSKLFRDSMGCPPQEFLIRLRLAKAADLMKGTRRAIGDIAARCGYPNQLHFSRAFKKRYGVSPREWRAQNQIRQAGKK